MPTRTVDRRLRQRPARPPGRAVRRGRRGAAGAGDHPDRRAAGRCPPAACSRCWRCGATLGTEVTLEAEGERGRRRARRAGRAARPGPRRGGAGRCLSADPAADARASGSARDRPAARLCRVAPPPALPAPAPVADPEAEAARAVARAAPPSSPSWAARADAARDQTAAEVLRRPGHDGRRPGARRTRSADGGRAPGTDAAHAIDAALRRAPGGVRGRRRLPGRAGRRPRRPARPGGRRLRWAQPMPGIPAPGHPFVLVARDLAPADTAGLDPQQVSGPGHRGGGPTSHTAILARSLGLPAVVGCAGALATSPTARRSPVDGATGEVEPSGVDEAAVDRPRRDSRGTAPERAGTARPGPGGTADGHPVALLANIGSAPDLRTPAPPTAEGVGLFRTELLFLDRTEAPGLDEQIAAYTRGVRARRPAAGWWCAPWTPARTSRCRSCARRRSPIRRSASAGCGSPGATRRCCARQLAAIAARGQGDRARTSG